MMSVAVRVNYNELTGETNVHIAIPAKVIGDNFYDQLSDALKVASKQVAAEISNRYIEENYAKICESLSPQAIANLSLAQAANNIALAVLPSGAATLHGALKKPENQV
jgi:hypothetical protein